MSRLCGLPNSQLYLRGAHSGALKQRMFASVLPHDLPSKTSHRLLRSASWAEVDGAFPAHTRSQIGWSNCARGPALSKSAHQICASLSHSSATVQRIRGDSAWHI
jgi:hypothetical protein